MCLLVKDKFTSDPDAASLSKQWSYPSAFAKTSHFAVSAWSKLEQNIMVLCMSDKSLGEIDGQNTLRLMPL